MPGARAAAAAMPCGATAWAAGWRSWRPPFTQHPEVTGALTSCLSASRLCGVALGLAALVRQVHTLLRTCRQWGSKRQHGSDQRRRHSWG